MHSIQIREDRCYAWVMMIFAAILFLAMFPLFLLIGIFSAFAVLAYRGPAYVSWRSPTECITPLSWVASEWNYEGIGGHQSGIRALGVEVSFNGVLR
ncbi:MAG TPA: hypothetical protein VJM53_10905 [Burkholderiales bacterium]|nr:hypothetical protein [Burkholderiales bacterium]